MGNESQVKCIKTEAKLSNRPKLTLDGKYILYIYCKNEFLWSGNSEPRKLIFLASLTSDLLDKRYEFDQVLMKNLLDFKKYFKPITAFHSSSSVHSLHFTSTFHNFPLLWFWIYVKSSLYWLQANSTSTLWSPQILHEKVSKFENAVGLRASLS